MAARVPSVKRYVVRLSAEERRELEGMIRKGKSPAQRLLETRLCLSVNYAGYPADHKCAMYGQTAC